MIQTRSERPYCVSIFFRKSANVVLSLVLPVHHLIGQRKTLRRHDQGNHHLHAVRALVAAVSEPTLVRKRRIALEIGGGQIVKQHVEARVEQRLPAFPQKREKRPLVLQQLVQTTVERVGADDAHRTAEQVPHGAVLVPVPVQPPLAARIDQLVAHQRLQHIQPTGALAARPQPRTPKPIQTQPIPQCQRQPTRTPLPWTVQAKILDVDPNHLAIQLRRFPIRRKQRHRRRTRIPPQHLDRSAPGRALTVVDLAQVQHLTLHHAIVEVADVLHHAPVTVFLAVLEAPLGTHEHGPIACPKHRRNQGARSALQPFGCHASQSNQRLKPRATAEIQSNQFKTRSSCGSRVSSGILQAQEPGGIQTLRPKLSVERLDKGIVRRLATRCNTSTR